MRVTEDQRGAKGGENWARGIHGDLTPLIVLA